MRGACESEKETAGKAEEWNAGGYIPVGFSGRPFLTSPLSFRSMCQLSVSPDPFFSVKPNTAPPFLIASLRSASLLVSAELMASKAADAGNLSDRIHAVSQHSVMGRPNDWGELKTEGAMAYQT